MIEAMTFFSALIATLFAGLILAALKAEAAAARQPARIGTQTGRTARPNGR